MGFFITLGDIYRQRPPKPERQLLISLRFLPRGSLRPFKYGGTLGGWTPVVIPAGPGVFTVGIATIAITDAGLTDSVKVSIPRTAAVAGKLFGHLQVVK